MAATFQTVVIPVSSAQLKSLVASPVTLAAAPGAGKLIQCLYVCLDYLAGATPYGVSGAAINIFCNGNSWNFVSFPSTGFFDQTVNTVFMEPLQPSTNFTSSSVINFPVVLGNTGTNLTSGNGSLKVTLTYQIVAIA